jgi:hypothetical protein
MNQVGQSSRSDESRSQHGGPEMAVQELGLPTGQQSPQFQEAPNHQCADVDRSPQELNRFVFWQREILRRVSEDTETDFESVVSAQSFHDF